jgi:hypothetical protein
MDHQGAIEPAAEHTGESAPAGEGLAWAAAIPVIVLLSLVLWVGIFAAVRFL